MGQFAGIDIGSAHTYSCVLDTYSRAFHYPADRMGLEEKVKWLRGFDQLYGGCVDGPPNPNTGQLANLLPVPTKHNTDRRLTEFKIGIGGCYSTRSEPPTPGATNFWMRSAFDLFTLLEREFDWSINQGGQDGSLIETHPTYAFKALLGCNRTMVDGIERLRLDPKSLLRRKHSKAGHQQRIELLTALCAEIDLTIGDDLLQRWNQRIDWVDAAIGAFMSSWQQSGLDELESPGETSEGAIFLRIPKTPFTVTTHGPTVAKSSTAKTKADGGLSQPTLPMNELDGVLTSANAIILRLGDTEELSQQDTIDIILSSGDLEEFWLPCVSNTNFSLCSNLRSIDGRFFLAWDKSLKIELTIDDCKDLQEAIGYPGNGPNPWPPMASSCRRWLRIGDAREIETTNFYVVHGDRWGRGFGDGQRALLWAVEPNEGANT